MSETLLTLALALSAGFAGALLLSLALKGRPWMQAAILAGLPPALLFAVFFVFFEGTPEGEDWFWLSVGLVYFWPWYLAWGAGCLLHALARRLRPSAKAG
jgi:hypothetical protein